MCKIEIMRYSEIACEFLVRMGGGLRVLGNRKSGVVTGQRHFVVIPPFT